MTLKEFQSIEPLISDHLKSIIDLKLIKQTLKKQNYVGDLNAVPETDVEKFYCVLCFNFSFKKVKAFPCTHFVCCENCIVQLYRKPNAKCSRDDCRCNLDQFEILNYWE